MNGLEMQVKFVDLLETTSRAFNITVERPYSTVVFSYLNEAQNKLFNERYLSGSFSQNVQTFKALKHELTDLLTAAAITLTAHTVYNVAGSDLVWTAEAFTGKHFVDGYLKVTRATIVVSSGTDIVEVTPMEDNQILNKYLTNYMNTPIILQPVVFNDSYTKSISVVHDKYTTIVDETGRKLYSTVVIHPTDITDAAPSKLDAKLHELIVRQAVEMFMRDKTKIGQAAPAPQPEERQ